MSNGDEVKPGRVTSGLMDRVQSVSRLHRPENGGRPSPSLIVPPAATADIAMAKLNSALVDMAEAAAGDPGILEVLRRNCRERAAAAAVMDAEGPLATTRQMIASDLYAGVAQGIERAIEARCAMAIRDIDSDHEMPSGPVDFLA